MTWLDVVLFILGWIVFNRLMSGSARRPERIEDPDDIPEDIPEPEEVKPQLAVIKINVEQINGWWYGFHTNSKGDEMFIAQGTTYEEAIANCKVRLQEKISLEDIDLAFQKQPLR